MAGAETGILHDSRSQDAEFVRYGVMHRNTYLDSPRLLDRYYRVKKEPRVCFARADHRRGGVCRVYRLGLSGRHGTGTGAGGKEPINFPRETAMGALALYISDESVVHFQPMNINFGLIPALGYRGEGKRNKNAELSKRALEALGTAGSGVSGRLRLPLGA